MKKFLLLSTLAVAMTANAADYGTSPETAVDFPGFWSPDQSLVDNKTEVWFKFKVTTQNGRPALYPSMPPSGEYQVFQCADGTMEAPKNSTGVYVVESGKEYLFKLVPGSTIIRKTKCSGFPKRNVPLPKTKRTFFSPLISDRHNPFQGCGGSVFMRL